MKKLRFLIPLLIAIRVVINTSVRMIYPFLPVFSRGLGVDLWQISLGITLRQAAGVAGPFLAALGDSRGRKAGMVLGLFLFTVGLGVMAAWPSYPAFVIALVLTMAGNLAFIPSMQAYLGDRVPYEQRALALGLTEIGWSLSFIGGIPLAGYLINRAGWSAPFPVLAGLGLLSLLSLAWLLPRTPRSAGPAPRLWQTFLSLVAYPPARAGFLWGFLFSAANEVVTLVFGVWMDESFGLKIAALAAASAVLGFSELGGEILVVGMTDRLGKIRAVLLGLALNSLALLALPAAGRAGAGAALAGLAGMYITFEFTLVSMIPLMSEVVPAARATLMAVFIACLSLGRAVGDLLAPPLYQWGKSALPAATILPIAAAALGMNLAAYLALRQLKREKTLGRSLI